MQAADWVGLPFESNTFDVVWGQDAWCHVADKAALVEEFARVLVSDGKLIFSDWLLSQPASGDNEEIRRIAASPKMANLETYSSLLKVAGFELVELVDNSPEFINQYRKVIKRLRSIEDEICEAFNRKVFDIVLSKQEFVLMAFEDRTLESCSFLAIRRS